MQSNSPRASEACESHHTIAQLGMYDWPEFRAELGAFWECFRGVALEKGLNMPKTLLHDCALSEVWTAQNMVLSMCCGWNVLSHNIGSAIPFARPVLRDAGFETGTYHSKIVCRSEDAAIDLQSLLEDPICNSEDSWSGYQIMLRWADSEMLKIGRCQLSGAHRQSLAMLLQGVGRVAMIDATCWRLAQILGETSGLTVLGASCSAPSPPFITMLAQEDQLRLMDALRISLASPEARGWTDALGLCGILPAHPELYDVMALHKSLS